MSVSIARTPFCQLQQATNGEFSGLHQSNTMGALAMAVGFPKAKTVVLCIGPGKAYDVPDGVLDWVYSFQRRLTRHLFAEALDSELFQRALDYKQSRGVTMAQAREAVINIAMGLKKHETILEACETKARVLYGKLFDG